jgi:hypothetical protein
LDAAKAGPAGALDMASTYWAQALMTLRSLAAKSPAGGATPGSDTPGPSGADSGDDEDKKKPG